MRHFLCLFLGLLAATAGFAQTPYQSARFPTKTVLVGTTGHTTAPVFVGSAALDNDFAGNTVVLTTTINAGETVVVFVGHTRAGATAVTSVVDSGGSVYTKQGPTAILPIASDYRSECWGTLSASASTTLTVTVTGVSAINVGIMRYTGVSAFGNTTSNGGTATTTQTCTLTMQDNNNVIVSGGLGSNSSASAITGAIVVNNYANNQGSLFQTSMRNTSASTGSLSTSWGSGPVNWAHVALELRSMP